MSFQVYPNPFSGNIHVDLGENYANVSQLVLYDITGREVLRRNFISQQQAVLDGQMLQKGMYLLTAYMADGTSVTKQISKTE
jgi:hypothetical protein